jgi:tetratricopeptide (TPR) repeat protein
MNRLQCSPIAAAVAILIGTALVRADDPPSKVGAAPADPAFAKLIGLAELIKGRPDHASALATIARAQAAAGDKEGSRRTFALAIGLVDNLSFDESKKYPPHILAQVGRGQFAAGDRPGAIASYRRVIELLDKAPDRDDHVIYDNYASIINYQIHAEDLEGVRIALEKGRRAFSKPRDPRLGNSNAKFIAYLHAAARDFNAAFAAIAADDAIKPLNPIKDELLSVIAHVAMDCDPAEGRIVLERALASAATIKKPRTCPGPGVAIAQAAAKLGDFDLAFRAEEAEAHRMALAPFGAEAYPFHQAQVFSVIALAQADAGLCDDARDTMARADIVARSIQEAPARRGALYYIRRARIKLGEYEEALRPIEGDNADIQSQILAEVAFAQEKAGDGAPARKLRERYLAQAEAKLRDVVERSPQRTLERSTAEAQVAFFKAGLGDIEGALKLLKDVRSVDEMCGALQGIARSQGRDGDGACEWIGRLDDPSLRTLCIQSFASGLAERNAAAKAVNKPKP